MPNFLTKLTNWFKPKSQPKKVKFIKSEPIKDELTLEQRLKRCEQLIEELTKNKEEKC